MAVIPTAPAFIQTLDYSAQEVRRVVSAIGDGGVLDTADLAVTQRGAGANMTVDVAAGSCIIPGAVGNYLCHSTSVTSVAISAAPGVGNERIDVIYAQVKDSEITGTDDRWEINVATGTASGSPTAPSMPSAYCIELGRVRLTSATTSVTNGIITSSRRISASPADTAWPYIAEAELTSTTATTAPTNWGTVVIPAPNRPIRIVAFMDGSHACGAGETNIITEFNIRTTYGSGPTVVIGTGRRSLSANQFSQDYMANTDYQSFTPGPGEDVTVAARHLTTAGTSNVDRGRLVVQVFPA